MTIQPSILIWTLICFAVLMLVLDRLLFRPMLSFMDKRNEKIAAARKKKSENERLIHEAETALDERRKLAAERLDMARETESEAAHRKALEIMSKAAHDSDADTEALGEKLANERAALMKELNTGVDDIAKAFADKLISHS